METKGWSWGRSKDSYEWTSLRGSDKKKMLDRLPPKIPFLLPEEGERVKELWEVAQNCIPLIHPEFPVDHGDD